MMQPTLTTERLILRPLEAADAPVIHGLAGDFAVADTTLNVPHPYEKDMAEKWIATHRAQYEEGTHATFGIVLKEAGTLVGVISLSLNPRVRSGELGYWIGAPYWSCGYCTEAAAALVDFAFASLKLHKVSAHHLARNPASGRVMQKIGMSKEGTLRDHVVKWDRYESIDVYGVLITDVIRATPVSPAPL
jgi:RimJ/RimL family protein N-acetyltransferase